MRPSLRSSVASVLASVVLVLPSTAAGTRADTALDVTLDAGTVRGIDAGLTHEWRGIPYAAPPIGELRWRPPTTVTPWAGVRPADEFGPPCIQLWLSDTETIGSEDCLYLNVFAPATIPTGTSLPVMVHLHPGGNTFGWPYQDASAFVAHDVIVVTVAYRLGVFGFSGHPELTAESGGTSGEYGILDQLAALHWVQRNIAAFGGDPGNVTLFGDSAGSFDATALVASPLGAGLFHKAALQTEAYWPFYEPPSLAQAELEGQEGVNLLGCGGAPDVTACMRSIPADVLVVAVGEREFLPIVGGLVLSASPRDMIAASDSTVPLLVGSNREEASNVFFGDFTLGGRAYPKGFYQRETMAIAPDATGPLRDLYPVADYESELWAGIAIWSDAIYTCPIRSLATTSSGPVWRYLYTHVYDNSEFLAGVRAGHFVDDPIRWLDAELLEGFGAGDYEFSAEEVKLSANMAAYWTNFAKTGDPNGDGLLEWPQYSDATEQTMLLDDPLEVVEHYHDAQCDFFDSYPIQIKPGWYSSGRFPAGIPVPGPR